MCCSYCGRSLTIFHRATDGNYQSAITAAVFLCISPQDLTVVWREFLPTFPSRSQLRLCVAPREQSKASANEKRAVLGLKCLSARVYKFSSPVVKTGHGFMILNLTWSLSTWSAVVHRTKRQSGDWYQRHRGTQQILLDNPSGSVCGGHDFNFGFGAVNATGRAVEAPIGSTITLDVQAAGQSR